MSIINMLIQLLEPLFRDVWMSRILVTIGIVVLFDVASGRFSFKARTQQQQSSSPQALSDIGIKNEQKDDDRKTTSTQSTPAVLTSSNLETTGVSTTAHEVSNDSKNSVVEMTGIDSLKIIPDKDEPKAPLYDRRDASGARSSSATTIAAMTASTTTKSIASGATHQEQQSRPKIVATSNRHPGMGDFAYWYDVETSLYRIYTLTRKDGVQVIPPYIPSSSRGNVNIFLHVTNNTNHTINVFWVDYKGNHVPKGKISPNHVWTQTTYIDHRKCFV
jgi:hypothetical protein